MADPILFLDADRTRFDVPENAKAVKRYVTKDMLPDEERNREYGWELPIAPAPRIISTVFRRGYVIAKIMNDGCYVDDGGGGADELFKITERCERENIWGELSELLVPFTVGSSGGDATDYDVYKFRKGERTNPVYMHLFPYAAGVTLDTRLRAPQIRRVAQEKPALFLLGTFKAEGKSTTAIFVDSKNSIVNLHGDVGDETAIRGVIKNIGEEIQVIGDVVTEPGNTVGTLTGIRTKKHSDFDPNFRTTTIGFGYPDYDPIIGYF